LLVTRWYSVTARTCSLFLAW